MQANDYQKQVRRTAGQSKKALTTEQRTLLNWGLGLTGEAGEVADLLKKHVFHGHELDREKLVKELGDVLWYLAALADTLQTDLSAVMFKNIEKLRKRYPNGFTQQDSLERRDVE